MCILKNKLDLSPDPTEQKCNPEIFNFGGNENAWLAQRRKCITGSDAAPIMGLSPYKTNIDVYHDKIDLVPPKEACDEHKAQLFERGHRLEKEMLSLFQAEYIPILNKDCCEDDRKYKCIPQDHNLYVNTIDGIPHGSSPDGLVMLGDPGENDISKMEYDSVVEVKSTYTNFYFKQWEKDRIPPHVYCQCLHYFIALPHIKRVYLVLCAVRSDVFSYDIRTWTINRDDEEAEIKVLLKNEQEFWKEYVQKQKKPELRISI